MVGTGMEGLPLPGQSMDVCLEGNAYGIGRNLAECTRIQKGRYGEELTARFLQERGLTIIERNWRCCFGEVDIIAEDNDTVVLVEVKTRVIGRSQSIMPEMAVGPRKRDRYQKLALVYLSCSYPRRAVRFDVAAVGIVDPSCSWLHYLTAAYEWDD